MQKYTYLYKYIFIRKTFLCINFVYVIMFTNNV